jgi:hypothetical protein
MSRFADAVTKSTWVTRCVPGDLEVTWGPAESPGPGNLLLCEVLRTGIHGRVERATGARSKIYAGDHIVCVVGARYATSMLEAVAEVGVDRVDMISASGLCGRVVARSRDTSSPTRLRPIAQAFVGSRALNVRDFALPITPLVGDAPMPRWVVVVGSSMDSGKTTACVSLIRGLATAGLRVGATKLTGTASARDFGAFRDAGASPVVDFLDAGWPSTVGCTTRELSDLLSALTGNLRAAAVDWGVIEIADGLLQRETRELLAMIEGQLGSCEIVLTVGDALGAVAGVDLLAGHGLTVGAVAGLVTNSPLACREVEEACGVPCVATSQLGHRVVLGSWVGDDLDPLDALGEAFV